MRVFKHYSPIAWFVVLSASLEGPNYGKKSAQVYAEHPRTSYVGQKTTTGQLSGLIYITAVQEEILSNNGQQIIGMTLFNIRKDNMNVFIQR